MAVFNEILAGRFNRAVQKLFGMKGPPPTPQLASEIIPIHPFLSGVENRYLEGWNQFTIASQQPAVAAQFSALQIRNPILSGVIAVLEMVSVFESVTDAFNLSHSLQNPADLTNVLNAAGALDIRSGNIVSGIPSNAVMIVSRQTFAAITDLGGGAQAGAVDAANDVYQFIQTDDQEIVILPGGAYRVCAQVANTTLTWSVRWRERVLEDSEKT